MMIWLAFSSAIVLLSTLLFFLFKLKGCRNIRRNNGKDRRQNKRTENSFKYHAIQKGNFSCAFFHPNCSAGGGGERTLFAALIAMKSKFPEAQFFLYIKANTKNQRNVAEIKKKAKDDFNLEIPDNLQLILLQSVFLAESKTWPRFTLLGQILGSIVLAFETMIKLKPDILIDTAGFPFIYPIIKLFNCRLVTYVHYPFISNDMIQRLQVKSYNNSGMIASSYMLRSLKIYYYKQLCNIYSFCGRFCDLVFTNSTWTHGHMSQLWKGYSNDNMKILFPPCDLSPFTNIKLERSPKIQVVSLSQFRPEKNHRLQLEIAAQVLKERSDVEFIFIGGCRGIEDETFVNGLKEYAGKLGITKSVTFKLNLPFPELLESLQSATIGLHTMIDEHFGIGIVELMAAGLITIANNSGGPRADIIKKDCGYLCSSATEYSQTISKIAAMSSIERLRITAKARENVTMRFSGEIFATKFSSSFNELLYK